MLTNVQHVWFLGQHNLYQLEISTESTNLHSNPLAFSLSTVTELLLIITMLLAVSMQKNAGREGLFKINSVQAHTSIWTENWKTSFFRTLKTTCNRKILVHEDRQNENNFDLWMMSCVFPANFPWDQSFFRGSCQRVLSVSFFCVL